MINRLVALARALGPGALLYPHSYQQHVPITLPLQGPPNNRTYKLHIFRQRQQRKYSLFSFSGRSDIDVAIGRQAPANSEITRFHGSYWTIRQGDPAACPEKRPSRSWQLEIGWTGFCLFLSSRFTLSMSPWGGDPRVKHKIGLQNVNLVLQSRTIFERAESASLLWFP